MKKILFILISVFMSIACNAQEAKDTISVTQLEAAYDYQEPVSAYEYDYYYPCDEMYFEFGVGGLLPTDDSNNFFAVDMELGKYINKYVGLGLNLKVSNEYEYNDKLNYIGAKARFRVNYKPINILDMDIHAGFGYGWYRFNEGYDYYDTWYHTISYVVPNIGVTGYVNLNRNISLGFEPSFMWYISTNKDESENVGVWNLMGKIRFRF